MDVDILSHLKFFHHKLHDVDEENSYMEREPGIELVGLEPGKRTTPEGGEW